MVICMVTNVLPPSEDPGFNVFVRAQIDSIAAAGHDVSTLWIDGPSSVVNCARSAKKLNRILRKKKYDIIHAHYGLSGIPACLQRHCPVVVSFCGDDFQKDAGGNGRITARSRASVWASQVIAHMANAVIVDDDKMIEKFSSASARHKTVVIPSGVDFDFFRPMEMPAARTQAGLDAQRRYVLFPASPERARERFDLARQAVDVLRARRPDVELVALHEKPRELVPVYMNACDVVLLTSEREASAGVVKESLACDAPVVCVDVGEAWRLIDGVDGCYRVQRDPRDIAEKLGLVLESGARSNGRSRIAHLALGAVAEKVVSVYESVLRKK
jgi:glycosyltransferase involved in cell wall biosynthesis